MKIIFAKKLWFVFSQWRSGGILCTMLLSTINDKLQQFIVNSYLKQIWLQTPRLFSTGSFFFLRMRKTVLFIFAWFSCAWSVNANVSASFIALASHLTRCHFQLWKSVVVCCDVNSTDRQMPTNKFVRVEMENTRKSVASANTFCWKFKRVRLLCQ